MGIKKIIKEEVDDFDWIREIPAHKLHYACDVINHIEEGDVVYLTGYAYYIDDTEDPNDPNHIEVRFDNDKGIVIKKVSIDGGVTYDYFDVKMDEKFFDNPEDTDEVSFHCEEHMVGWDDPNKNIKLRLEKPLKESNDFDWAKETNPIQYKDLKGYYFFYGNNPKKYIISDVTKKDDYGINRVHYVWWDTHNDEYDENSMDCDTLINRVKNGGYKLYDKNGVEVNPRDLVYTDNTFDDDERKEIWEQDESDDLDWIKDTKPSRKNKLDFSKEKHQTTKNYDSVNIGDKFRPPGSYKIWTVVDKVLHKTRYVSDVYWKKQPKGDLIEIETYWVYVQDEYGKVKLKIWDTGWEDGGNTGFPGTYKSWEKVIESVNESDELDWIKDIKSNQDIAQEIADETKIKKNKRFNTPFPSFPTNVPLHHINAQFPSFIKYGKKRYGLNDEDYIQDVWKRYKDIITDKINNHSNLNESKKIDRYAITGNQWTDIEKDPNGPFVLWKDAGKPKNVTRITPVGYGRMRDAYKGDWIRYDDVYEDEWEWARTTKPIELQDPKEWIGRQFGYGQEIIDQMDDGEINMSHDEEIFTITGIDENDNLILVKHHPVYGDNHDSSTSPRNLRDYISKGKWVWI